MSQIHHSIVAIALAVVSLAGCAHDTRATGGANPIYVADTKAAMRDLWTGHIFWIRNVVSDNAVHNAAARDAAEQEVVVNAKKIANTITPFYGEES
jgi:hypothetical protein